MIYNNPIRYHSIQSNSIPSNSIRSNLIMMYFNIWQLLVIPHPAVPVAMYLFELNFQIEL